MIPFGYCTNIHAARTIEDIETALECYASPLRKSVCPNRILPVGLWFPASALQEFSGTRLQRIAEHLSAMSLSVTTLNGFPYGDFHQEVVKHRVYEPSWAEPTRLEYTMRLAEVLAVLAAAAGRGTISTVPLGWTGQADAALFRQRCGDHLRAFARFAASIEERSGFHVRLCLEPEPGCYLGNSRETREYLCDLVEATTPQERSLMQRYLGVCHDICHAAVMFEDQVAELAAYRASGICIGKVQVSSAVCAHFDRTHGNDSQRDAMLGALREFVEPKYLHQTNIDGEYFYEDLPLALKRQPPAGEWRVHFHVPIFAAELRGGLSTTQGAIKECVRHLGPLANEIDWEIETYAWQVLPPGHFAQSLPEILELEYRWLESAFAEAGY